jgi:predicted alpha-1,2-mannosidase
LRLIAFILFFTTLIFPQGRGRLIDYVNPFIGTEDGGGAVFVGACLPFSLVRLGPDTPLPQNTSGYVPGKPIDGFSHLHVSGTGGPGKYGNIMVIPENKLIIKNYSSDKSDEAASPGYYTVKLNRWNVKAELTAAERVGFHRYTFNDNEAYILFDLSRAVNVVEFEPGYSIDANIRITSDNEIEGYGTYSGGWGPDVPYTIYFAAKFDKHFSEYGIWRNGIIHKSAKAGRGDSIGAFLKFNLSTNKIVNIKIGISLLSVEKAKQNLKQFEDYSFDQIKERAEKIWEEKLNLIKVEGGTEEEKELFYTSLYHSMLMPTDVTGENPRWNSDKPHYWDYFAIWDTFRSLHPLLTLIQKDRQIEMIKSLVDTYEHTGWMPECWTSGTHGFMQGGTNCDVLIADAAVKGLKGIDFQKAYEAIKKDADVPSDAPREYGRDSDEYLRLGYSSSDKWCGSSRTLEYAYNDFCVAQAAKYLGKEDDYKKYLKRSLNCYNLFMNDTKFFWAKNPDGTWVKGFSPTFRIEEWWEGPYFYEGLPWHYSTYVPHDIGGLINRHGGNKKFVSFLDEMFDGGFYTQDNQPDIMTPYLYIYAGRPDKTTERVHNILKTDYRNSTNGLPGQDDAGCMSSWYVFSSMGFYPNAGQDIYFLSSPIFSKVEMNLGNGKIFKIIAKNLSDKNIYIQSAELNGKDWTKAWFQHKDIVNGAELILTMGSTPSNWGTKDPPPSVSDIQ